jgi:regulator of sirC expression with transglutaminase-like and TPR domain
VSAKSTPEPYVGPRPFDREDYARFFGRFREADDLLSLVLAHPVVLIYAASGAGKTSLLNAGLIPRLAEGEFQILGPARVTGPVPLGTGEITNIYRFHALAEWNSDLSPSIAMASELASLSLADFLHRLDVREPGRPRVLLFDQFEEFFAVNVAQSEQRRAFIEELAQSLSAAPRLKVVFAMREDYVTQFEPFAYILPDKLRTRMRLEPLRARAAVQAIREPLKAFDLSFEEGTNDPAEALVRELLKISVITETGQVREITGEFVDPLQLQVVCQNMWHNFPPEVKAYAEERQTLSPEAKRPAKKIRADQVRIEDVDLALAHHYERAITEAVQVSGASEGQLRRWFGSSLITGAGMRGIALASSDETAQLPESALKVFLDQRLVQKESRGGSEWYELTHDRFIEPIQRSNRAWFEQWADNEALLRKLEAKAGAAGARLDEKETREAEAFLASPDARVLGPSEKVESLVMASRRHVDKEARQRRIKLTLAWSTIAVLLAAALVSFSLFLLVRSEKNKAIKQKRIAQAATLRARKQNFEDYSLIATMADRLVQLSAQQEAVFWHVVKAGALGQVGMHEESINEYDLVLQLDPGNLRAKIDRGYEHYTQREADEALQDTESYLEKVSTSWSAHQYRGLCLSLLGQYAEADKAIRDSIREFHFTGSGQIESEVAPDIQAATGHTIIWGDETLWQTANYYQLASLKAYTGSEEFDAVLTEADKQPNSGDAALIALDWAWLHMEKRKEDYGALVAQGALWERAGFNEWAKKYYDDFESIHKKRKDRRYEGLARWAAHRRLVLALKGYREPKNEKSSVNILKLEADELFARGKPDEALRQINRAIDISADDVTLYLSRAGIYFWQRRYRECRSDCDLVLKKAPNSALAYFLRARANQRLKAPPEIIVGDLREALRYDPGNGSYMEFLSAALYDRAKKEGFETSRRELDETLQLLEGSASAENLNFDELPYIYYRIALVHCARGNFEKAIKPLETAIAAKDDDSAFYMLWREAQKGLGNNEAQASCSLADLHRQIAETKLRLDNSGKALDACWRGLEALTADEKQVNEADLKQEMAAIMSEISQIIERAGSKAKATEFWQSIAKLESMKLLRDGAKAELERLARTR